MNPLGHAEAHERLADLALEPGALDRLGDPSADPLAAHVAACDACARDVAAWRRTAAQLDAARGRGDDRIDLATLAGDDPIGPPATLRGRVLEAVRGLPPRGEPGEPARGSDRVAAAVELRRRPSPGMRLLPLAAVFAAILVSTGLVLERQARLDAAAQQAVRLAEAAEAVDRILRAEHVVVDLVDERGVVAGSISWSRHDVAIFTTRLTEPPAGQVYRCWIERDGVRSPVGRMFFAGSTGYWTGSLDDWAEVRFDGTFGISLEPLEGSEGNPPVLTGDLDG